MSRKRVPQKKLPALLAELQEREVTEVRRHPPRMDGTVLVTWREPGPPTDGEGSAGEMTAWVPAVVMSVAFVAMVVAVVVGLLMARVP